MASYVQSMAPGPTFPDEEVLDGEGDVARGAELFRVNCAMCHNVAAAGGALTEGKYAPALGKTSALHMYAAMVTGPQNMPVFNDLTLTPEDKRDIISSLLFLQQNESPGGFSLGSLGPVSEGLFIWIFGIGAPDRPDRVDHGEVQLIAFDITNATNEDHHGTRGRPARARKGFVEALARARRRGLRPGAAPRALRRIASG